MFGWMVAETAGWSRAKNIRDSPVQLLYNFTVEHQDDVTKPPREGCAFPPPTKNLLGIWRTS